MGIRIRPFALSLGLLLLLGPSGAGAQEEEEIETLQRWLEEPLDLREATVEELALLPWLGREQAEAVVGLREAGGLARLEDLERVPGLGPDQRRALGPFVSLPAPAPAPRLWVRRRRRLQQGEPRPSRDRLRAALRGWRLSVEAADGRPRRLAAGWEGRRTALWAGGLRVRLPWNLLWDDPLARGRSGAAALGRGFAVAPHTSLLPGDLRGAAGRGAILGGETLVAVGRDDTGPDLRWLMAHERVAMDRTRVGAAVRDGGWACAWASRPRGASRWRVEAVVDLRRPVRPTRLAAAVQWRQGGLRLGGGLAVADGAGPAGRDPLSGLALDRPHRAVQIHGSGRVGALRLSALLRRQWRDGQGRRRLQTEVEGRGGAGLWRLRLRLDEDDGPTPTWTTALAFEPRGAASRPRLRLRRRRVGAREAFLAALAWRGRGRLAWSVEAAAMRGELSSPWYGGLPAVGLEGRWSAGPAAGVRAGLSRPVGPCLLAAWAEVLLSESLGPAWRGGWQLTVGSGP